MKLLLAGLLLIGMTAESVTFEEFYATANIADIPRAYAAWRAIEYPPPPPPPPPTPEEIAAAQDAALAPIVYDRPIEAPSLIVQSHTNAFGVALAADDQGGLVTAIVHQSPYHSTNAAAQIAKAFAARDAARLARSNELAGIRARAVAAASVPALRAEVERLAAIVDQMGSGR